VSPLCRSDRTATARVHCRRCQRALQTAHRRAFLQSVGRAGAIEY